MRYLSQLKNKDLADKTVLLRLDLNINNPTVKSTRLLSALQTIKFLLQNKSKIIIISHRGRPNGFDPNLTLKPLIEIIYQQLPSGQCGSINYFENLRFNKEEEANDSRFAKTLAQGCDLYVNDAFAVCHRKNASLVAITKFLPSFAGLTLEKEIKTLTQVRDHPQKPLVVIIGGIKIQDKANLIKNLGPKASYFLMGSAYMDLKHPALKKKNVVLPQDWVNGNNGKLDIGPKTIERYKKIIQKAKTIIWNGPLGFYENEKYSVGTLAIAKAAIAARQKDKATVVVGGGDTDQFLFQKGLANKVDFISTGGGAMLAFLSGKILPGLAALNLSFPHPHSSFPRKRESSPNLSFPRKRESSI